MINGVLLGLSIAAPIGPTNIEIIRRGLKEGWKSSAVFCLGVNVVLIVYLMLVISGLSFLTKSELFNNLLLLFGVAVLFYLAYNSFADFFKNRKLDLSAKAGSGNNFIPGVVLTISNPAVLLFWTGILGADLASSSATFENGLKLSLGILIGVMLFTSFLILLVQFGRRFVTASNFKYVSLAAGFVLAYFAAMFGLKLLSSTLFA
ncbi:LysE family transporter [Candidatus Woesearchaeota archaeon]|nr:LysE family transporter [Candidatus Woesearchaeota archaeon]